MKRRVLSLVIAVALCLNLCPVWGSAAGAETDADAGGPTNITYTGPVDYPDGPFEVSGPVTLDTCGYKLTAPNSGAIRITGTGSLDFTGTAIAGKDAGVEVQSGGILRVTGSNTYIQGSMYALDVAAGADVKLSAGKYFGKSTAIQLADGGDYAALLADGCAYFSESGAPLRPEDITDEQTVVVGPCTDHSKAYTPNAGTPTHDWTCRYCGKEETAEACTFQFKFNENGNGVCACGHALAIAVDEDSLGTLDYTDTVKPANGIVKVTLDGTTLPETGYTVSYSTRAEVGETAYTVTVTVEGTAYNGTFTHSYLIDKANQLVLEWEVPGPVTVPYTGSEVTKAVLPVKINITSTSGVALQDYLQYSYRVQGSGAYTQGLPTNAGTYDVVVTLPEEPVNRPDYQAASSAPITLVIEKISPIIDAPAAAQPVFNGRPQALVTAGTLHSAAAGDGVAIKFSDSKFGTYTTEIPAGTNAGDYEVWYQTDETDNYTATLPTQVENVLIRRKPVTPVVELSDSTYLYDGGFKEPKVTVKDEDHVTVLPDTEYQVAYQDNRDVGTAKAVVTDRPGGNYALNRVEAQFRITARAQAALSITNQPDTVTYGDTFTLGTSGGSGNGEVTWKITSGQDAAAVGEKSGQVTVTGHGPFTVQATKSGKEPDQAAARAADGANYEDAIASVAFTAAKKPVTATVTADDKTYNGTTTTAVHAVVEQGVLPGDVITITLPDGEFSDENAGTDKTVQVDTSSPGVTGTNSEHYDISYSSDTAPVKASIHKATATVTAVADAKGLVYTGAEQALITGVTVDVSGVLPEYALSEDGPYSTDFPKAVNAGAYTVWYRVQETNNYTGLPPASISVEIGKKPVVPAITLDRDSFVYDGSPKEPAVTLTEADGTTVIPAGEYTVAYSDNVSAGNAAAVTVTAKPDGNYSFTAVTKSFTITQERAKVTAAPEPAGEPLTFSNRAQKLVTPGTGTGGTMVYSTDGGTTWLDAIPTGTQAKEYTVHYKIEGDANHNDSEVGSVTVTIAPKTVKDPTVELFDGKDDPFVSCVYDGTPKIPAKIVVKDGSTVINAGEYNIVYSDNTDAGRAAVNITAKPGGNYTVTGSAAFVIEKADITFTTAPAAANVTYDGKSHELLIPGTPSGGTVLYALGGPNKTYADAIPEGVEAGAYIVYYKVEGDKNHNDFPATPVANVAIKRKPLDAITIELTPDAFVYDGTVKLPAVTVRDGKTVLPEEEYEWTCSEASPTNKGTYTITITKKPGINYDLTGIAANMADFTIGQTAQAELVIEGIPDTTVYGDTFTLTTSGGSVSGADVKWEVTAGTAAAVGANGEVKITGTGDVTITATNPGDQNYMPVSARWTFTAEPKTVTASVTVASRAYDGTTNATVASAEITALAGDTVTIDPGSITAAFDTPTVGTGKTVTLDASNVQVSGDDAGKYAIRYPASVMADITAKAAGPVKVDLTDADLKKDDTDGTYYYEYDGTVKTPAVTVKDKDGKVIPPDEYTVNYSGNKFAGKASVTIAAKADGNYSFADKTVNFFIREAGAVLTRDPQAKDLTYNGGMQDLVDVGTADGGTVVYSLTEEETASDPYSETVPQGKDAGVYTVYFKVRGDANHTGTAARQVSVTIRPKEFTPEIELAPASDVYDGNAKTPNVTVKDGDTILSGSGADAEYTVSYRDNVNAGTATVIVSDKSGGNYIVNGTATFEIAKAPPVCTPPAGQTGLRYSGERQELVTAGVCNEGVLQYSVNGGSYSPALPTASAVGTYTIEYMVKGDGNHSDTTPATLGPVEITKNTVTAPTITLSSDSFRYNGSQQKPTVTVKDDNSRLIPEHEYEVTITGAKSNNMVDVDVYTVTVTTPDTSNYVISTNNTRTFAIVPADQETLSITGAKAQVFYGDVIQLGVTGGSGGGTIQWKVTGADGKSISSEISPTGGLLTVKDVGGPYRVTATCSRDNYSDVSATWEFSAGKKPVTAVVTVAAKDFDGSNSVATAAITAAVQPGDLAFSGDSITIGGLTAVYEDENAGTGKTVTVDHTHASVTGTNAEKYDVAYPATTTASIRKAAAEVTAQPGDVTPALTYDASQAQALVTAGTATGGTMVYSLDGTNYAPAIPKAKDAGPYTVYFKVQGDQNHTDSEPETKAVTIVQQEVTPRIELSPPGARYDGSIKRPEAIVRDAANNVIPAGEYTVVYDTGTNWKDAGDHKVRVQNLAGGNYIVETKEADFTISTTAQAPLEIVNKPGLVYYGDTFTLSATGGSGGEKVTWSSSDAAIADVDANGLVTIKGTGSATITAKKAGGGNYEAAEASYPLNALKKPVKAIVTAEDRVYASGDTSATLHVDWNVALVEDDEINTSNLRGTFADDKAGPNKTVTVTGDPVSDAVSQKYDITIPPTTTASILKADRTAPVLTKHDRTYDRTAQDLVSGGTAGTRYSDSQNGVYAAAVPTGTNAGTYTVWYREEGDENHNASAPQAVTVTISPKTPAAPVIELSGNDLQKDADGTYYYAYDGTEKTPAVTVKDGDAVIPVGEYTVTYSNNKNVSTDAVKASVTVTDNADGNYTVNGSASFEIRKSGAQLTAPPQKLDLTYTGQAQALVSPGTAAGGYIVYAVGDTVADGDYKTDIPTGTNVGVYTVHYKVIGDGNHSGTTAGSVSVTIRPKEIVSPKVTVSGSYTFTGSPQVPAKTDVKVEDGAVTIPDSEYVLSYRDNVNAGTATVIVTNANGGNYIVNGTGTFEIAKAGAPVPTAPEGLENLPYNGESQELATAGSVSGGTMVYALSETGAYSPAIPAQKAVDTYTVWYKVLGDGNHEDGAPASVPASIIVNRVTDPVIQITPAQVTYTGKKQQPTVTVRDGSFVIDGSEYTVQYKDSTGSAVTELTGTGTYTLTITGVTGGNYTFETAGGKNTAAFEILPADQTPMTITGTRERVYYGDTIPLGTAGGNGTVTWDVGSSTIAEITDGLLKITGSGASVTVTAASTKEGYAPQTAVWTFYAEKKPVTAVVTAEPKTYDGVTPATATVTAALQSSDLVGSGVITIKLTGTFEDPNAGTDKKVMVDSSHPVFTGSTGDHDNYAITYPATTTASIFKAKIEAADVTPPEANPSLEYTGLPLTLVKAGTAEGGVMEYSPDNITYSAALPTGTGADGYEIWYRVRGDGNHEDTEAQKLDAQVTISKQDVTDPIVECSPTGASYDGKEHKPAVTVKDKYGRVIPDSEYDVAYGAGDWTKAGDYEVTVSNKADGNYVITQKTAKFTITHMGQSPLSIMNQPGLVQYGDRSFTLTAVGGSGTGTVVWNSDKTDVASIDQNGLVTVHKAGGPVTITATKQADGGYAETSVTWSFSVEKKVVRPTVTAKDKVYDEDNRAELVITWKDGDLLDGDAFDLESVLTGTFDDANVGTGKKVTVSGSAPASEKYDIKIPASTTASITPKAAALAGSTATELEYNGNPQPLVSGVTATNGVVAYSRDGSYYTLICPKETRAGTYTVYYKAQAAADGNYKDSPAVRVDVTIRPKPVTNPGIELSGDGLKEDAGGYYYEYDGAPKRPDVVVKDGSTVIAESEYTVTYSGNTAVGTASVKISNADGGNYEVSGKTVSFTIKAGAPALAVEPQPRTLTYNGREQTLVTRGTAVNGHMEYSFDEYDDYSTAIPKGTDAGTYEVWYKVVGDGDANETNPECVIAEILPKSVTPTVTVNLDSDPLPYTGKPQKPSVSVAADGKTLTENVDYTVTYSNNTNAGTAKVTVQSVSGGNYQFSASAEFEIAKSKAAFDVEPVGSELVYTGEEQRLIEAYTGTSLEGIVLYSLDAVTYSAEIPTGTSVRTYRIYTKVQGDSAHEDSDVKIITASIKTNEVQNPQVTLSSNSLNYTGGELKPAVTVTDGAGRVIPASEYTAVYSDNINVGTATVTVTSKGSNYSFKANATFKIIGADQTPLEITGRKDAVYYGDVLSLGTAGGSGNGAVTWSAAGSVERLADGQYKVSSSGSVTITATKAAGGGYGETSDTWTFYARPKPVTAVVTAANKPYDGTNTANLTVTISSGLVGSDTFTVTAEGHFTDANAEMNKTVVVDSLTVSDEVKAKYDLSGYNNTTTASITPKAAAVLGTDTPVLEGSLTYNGGEQPLLTNGGTAEGGNLMYSLDGRDYAYAIPTGTDAKTYTVWYKVEANSDNYKDSVPVKLGDVTISANQDKPRVTCTPAIFQYDGTPKTPAVIVTDSQGHIIPENEYTVAFEPDGRIAVGKYKVTVTDKPGGNYAFPSPGTVTETFEIAAASQNPLSVITDKHIVYYGDTFRLSAMGGSGNGAIQWSIPGSSAAEIDANGVVTVTGTGGFTVEAYKEAADGYSKSNTVSVPFEAKPKPVTPVVTAESKPYDGTVDAALHASWPNGALVGSDAIDLSSVSTGTFDSADVGTDKRVTFIPPDNLSGVQGNYVISWPDSAAASIYKVDAKLDTVPVGSTLTYTGSGQALVTGGSTVDGIGRIVYSLTQNGTYTEDIPTAVAVGTYDVWYKVADSVNYTGIPAASVRAEIRKATPVINTNPTAGSGTVGQSLSAVRFSHGGAASIDGTFAWKDGGIVLTQAGTALYDVTFTPADAANYETVTFQIPVTVISAAGGGTGDTPPAGPDSAPSADANRAPSADAAAALMQTTVRDGAANTVVSPAAGSRLVREAAASRSSSVVIQPEITGGVTKAEVSIPASTVNQIKDETDAALTVSTPIADATISRAALDTLGSAGGDVSVAAEQKDQTVVLTLTADGEKVEDLPGGVTLSVPAEDAGPGTVAVLVHEDGTRETIRKSTVEDGKVNIPLSGSATVEIVDNSKAFADVPSTNWAAGAVAFASAHELFNGTSETTFSPDQPMSRGMLATVLYNLEGQPDQDLTMRDLESEYDDVSSDAWYAQGVAWAVENGIANGYGNGGFGPDDNVTREQLAVMLWKYAGSPAADRQDLDFADADQAGGYARDALCWAVEKGIMSGHANGQLDPGGPATRAQAAKMLQNFLENA